jgi:plasmid stabilization system protein ParE
MSSLESLSGLGTAGMWQTSQNQESRQADFEARFLDAALAAGLDPNAANSLQDEIRAAIAAAQKSDDNSDRRQTIQNAIDGVLENHGVDLTKFKSQMQPPAGGVGGAPPQGGPPPGGSRQADFQSQFIEAAVAAGLDEEEADELQDEIRSAIDALLANSDSTTNLRQSIRDTIDARLEEHGVDLSAFKTQLELLTGSALEVAPLVDEQA